MPLQDWNTILQLSVAYNLVLGAYTSYRQDRETKMRDELNEAGMQIKQIGDWRKLDIGIDSSNRPTNLQDRHLSYFGTETLGELNAYRRDITIRFMSGYFDRRRGDEICNFAMVLSGALSLAGLFAAAVNPLMQVNAAVCGLLSAVLLGVPLAVMARSYIHKRLLDGTAQRPDGRAEGKVRNKNDKFCSVMKKGEVHTITLHIKRLYNKERSNHDRPHD